MIFDSTIHKDSRTHEIEIEFNNEEIISASDLLNTLNTLAMVVKPMQKKVLRHANHFVVTVRAKKYFTSDAFLAEHKPFMDSLAERAKIQEN